MANLIINFILNLTMKNKPIIFFLLMAALYGQWALWSNPSLPVGETDKGFGAEKGQLYYGIQSYFSSIDWWHDPVKGEPFKHSGALNTFIVRPSIIYGISKKYNLILNSTLGIRKMNWNQPMYLFTIELNQVQQNFTMQMVEFWVTQKLWLGI